MTPRQQKAISPGDMPKPRSRAQIIRSLCTVTAALAVFFLMESALVTPVLSVIAAGAIALVGSVLATHVGVRFSRKVESSPGLSRPASEHHYISTCLTLLDAGVERMATTRLDRVVRSAERVREIEQELIRRICEHYPTDRRMRALMVELQICSSRLKARLDDCRSHEILPISEAFDSAHDGQVMHRTPSQN